MRHLMFLTTACGVAACLAMAAAQQPQQPPRLSAAPELAPNGQQQIHTLNIKVYEKRGDSQKNLADPTILAADKKPFSFISGGEIAQIGPALEFGISVDGSVETIEGGVLQVAMRISIGNPVPSDDPDIVAVRSRSIDVRMKLKRSAKTTFQVDADTWFDICAN
ncbi:MAG: hypothetical protein ACK5PZ_16250 [Pirellula sp.]